MTVVNSILDDLVLLRAELPRLDPLGTVAAMGDPKTNVALRVAGSRHQIQFGAPFFVRDLGPAQLGIAWSYFCELLRRHRIPLFSSVATLEKVPASAVPPRLGRRFINEPLDATELSTADAFEIECRDRGCQHWGWSSEIEIEQLDSFVSAVRQAAGGDTPVGIGLPSSGHTTDLRHCLDANVDFISLIADSRSPEAGDIQGLVTARRMCRELGRSTLPIMLTLPATHPEHLVKLLALGASAVCLDAILLPHIPDPTSHLASSPIGGGMLSNISAGPTKKKPSLPDVERQLAHILENLQSRLRDVGASDLTLLNGDCLRSCSNRCEQVTGAKPLVG